jgi:hypothetical protein
MSVEREFTVWCDVCSDWIRVQAKNETAARREARGSGWTYSRASKEDRCPRCTERRKGKGS